MQKRRLLIGLWQSWQQSQPTSVAWEWESTLHFFLLHGGNCSDEMHQVSIADQSFKIIRVCWVVQIRNTWARAGPSLKCVDTEGIEARHATMRRHLSTFWDPSAVVRLVPIHDSWKILLHSRAYHDAQNRNWLGYGLKKGIDKISPICRQCVTVRTTSGLGLVWLSYPIDISSSSSSSSVANSRILCFWELMRLTNQIITKQINMLFSSLDGSCYILHGYPVGVFLAASILCMASTFEPQKATVVSFEYNWRGRRGSITTG